MICHGNKSNAHLGLWSLQKYKFGDVQNVDFFFIFQIFPRVLKVFIKSFYVWSYSAKNDLRQHKIGYNLPWKQLSCTFRGWSLQAYKYGDVQNVDFFFHIPDFF